MTSYRNRVRKNREARKSKTLLRRPQLETIEERLPPGDTVLGGLLARYLIGPGASFSSSLFLLGETKHIAVTERLTAGSDKPGGANQPSLGASRWSSVDQDAAAGPPRQTLDYTTSSTTSRTANIAGMERQPVNADLFDLFASSQEGLTPKNPRSSEAGVSEAQLTSIDGTASAPPGGPERAVLHEEGNHSGVTSATGSFEGSSLPTQATGPGTWASIGSAQDASSLPPTGRDPANNDPRLAVARPAGQGEGTGPGAGTFGYLETLTIPTEKPAGVASRTVLQVGVTYTLIAAGDVRVGTSVSLRGDAAFQDFTHPRKVATDGVTPVGLTVASVGVVTSWGPFHPHHIYRMRVTGQGLPLVVSYSDQASAYSLHQGSLSVTLYQGVAGGQSGRDTPAHLAGGTPPNCDCGCDDGEDQLVEEPDSLCAGDSSDDTDTDGAAPDPTGQEDRNHGPTPRGPVSRPIGGGVRGHGPIGGPSGGPPIGGDRGHRFPGRYGGDLSGWKPAGLLNSAPALANDGGTLYEPIRKRGQTPSSAMKNWGKRPIRGGLTPFPDRLYVAVDGSPGYLVALDSSTLAYRNKVALRDPRSASQGARLSNDSTQSRIPGGFDLGFFGPIHSMPVPLDEPVAKKVAGPGQPIGGESPGAAGEPRRPSPRPSSSRIPSPVSRFPNLHPPYLDTKALADRFLHFPTEGRPKEQIATGGWD